MPVRLTYRGAEFDLVPGAYTVGRGAGCQLVVDSTRASRKHALLTIRTDSAVVEDLGSRNGVFVNGAPINGRTDLENGDVVSIGGDDLTIWIAPGFRGAGAAGQALYPARRLRLGSQAGGIQQLIVSEPAEIDLADSRTAELPVLVGEAEKCLRSGDPAQARALLSRPLAEVLATARAGFQVDADLAQFAAFYAARLAASTLDSYWFEYVFDLYTAVRRPIPRSVLESLRVVVIGLGSIDRGAVEAYLQAMHADEGQGGAADDVTAAVRAILARIPPR